RAAGDLRALCGGGRRSPDRERAPDGGGRGGGDRERGRTVGGAPREPARGLALEPRRVAAAGGAGTPPRAPGCGARHHGSVPRGGGGAAMIRRMRRINRVHFVGIGGSGMSGIAEVMLSLGYEVQG